MNVFSISFSLSFEKVERFSPFFISSIYCFQTFSRKCAFQLLLSTATGKKEMTHFPMTIATIVGGKKNTATTHNRGNNKCLPKEQVYKDSPFPSLK